MVQCDLSCKVGMGLQYILIPHLALVAGIGENNTRFAGYYYWNDFVNEFRTHMSSPRKYLDFVGINRYNLDFLFLMSDYFYSFVHLRALYIHCLIEVSNFCRDPPASVNGYRLPDRRQGLLQ